MSKTKWNTVLCRKYVSKSKEIVQEKYQRQNGIQYCVGIIISFMIQRDRPREISKTKWNTVLCRKYVSKSKEIVQEKCQRQNGIQYCVGIIISFMIQRDRPREISKTKWNTVLCRNYNIFHDPKRSSKRNIKDKMEYSIV